MGLVNLDSYESTSYEYRIVKTSSQIFFIFKLAMFFLISFSHVDKQFLSNFAYTNVLFTEGSNIGRIRVRKNLSLSISEVALKKHRILEYRIKMRCFFFFFRATSDIQRLKRFWFWFD